MTPLHEPEDTSKSFEAAWEQFGRACSSTVAPEATYQAWFAHFLIQSFGLLRVVREVDFGSNHLDQDAQVRFPGSNLMVDVVVLREPIVNLPRRAWLGPPGEVGPSNPRSGLGRLAQFAVISELKVAASVGGGLKPAEVLRDVHKLDALLRNAHRGRRAALPLAYACVLANDTRRHLNPAELEDRVNRELPGTPVRLLVWAGRSVGE